MFKNIMCGINTLAAIMFLSASMLCTYQILSSGYSGEILTKDFYETTLTFWLIGLFTGCNSYCLLSLFHWECW